MKHLISKVLIILAFILNVNVSADINYPYKKSVKEQYEFAMSFLKAGHNSRAEKAFKEFVQINPKHKLAGNAQYWYAETLRIRGRWIDAAEAYLVGHESYPKGHQHAAMNFLKLGISMVQIQEKDVGCKIIMSVRLQYPKAKSSIISRAESSAKKWKCKNTVAYSQDDKPQIVASETKPKDDKSQIVASETKPKDDKSQIVASEIQPKKFRKFNNLINFKIDKKKIIMSDVEALAVPSEKPVYYIGSSEKKYSTKEDHLNNNLYRFFIQNSEKHNLLNPGDIFRGIINLEILYNVKLYKKRKNIQRYIDNTKLGKKWFNMPNDKKTIRSLIQMKESIEFIREELGISKEKSTQEALNTYLILNQFLNKDRYERVRGYWYPHILEQKKLMKRYLKYLNEINKTLKHAEKNI